jgi:dihydroxynaphthoic acid synthetase
MPTNSLFETSLSYDAAGVRFNVNFETPPDQDRTAFSLTVDNLVTGKRLPFGHDDSPAIHDFTRNLARALGRFGIKATANDDEIRGEAQSNLSSSDLLKVVTATTDRIDQRFSNYKQSVIGHTTYSDIVYEKRDGVAYLMINRAEVLNAKRGWTMNEMADALLDAAKDPSLRAVVISGAGPLGFCTGNDQSYDREVTGSGYAATAEIGYQAVINQMPQPVIAAVDGLAVGSGNIMAYFCDFTIATTRSRFGQAGPRVGSPASGHSAAALAARVGQKRAREIWYLCRLYSAQEAYDMGLVNKVVEPDDLWTEVDRWLADIKRMSPVLLQTMKMSFRDHDNFIIGEKSPAQQHVPDYNTSEEAKERRLSFIERRPLDESKNLPYVQVPIR